MGPLVDRDQEASELRQLHASDGFSLGLLYGRRRVGKTYLLRHSWDPDEMFYFLIADETADQNRRECLHELQQSHESDILPEDYPNWRTVFRLLVDQARNGPLVVILDEFQYLLDDPDRDVASKLSAVLEESKSVPLTLILCGSEISLMKSLNEGKGAPLYGRFDWAHRLEPFTYLEAAEMLGNRPARDQIKTYAVYGGIPGYLAAIPETEPLKQHAIENILSPRGPVHLPIKTLFEQERGIRDAAAYHSILSAIASGHTTVNEIAQASGVTGEGNINARNKLDTLMSLFLVDREKNRDSRKGPYRYYITDHGVDFWYRFVRPARSRLEMEAFDEIWDDRIEPRFNSYVGQIFEHVCRQAIGHFSTDWGLKGIEHWGRWQGQDRNRQSIEIDIVADLTDGSLLTGEIKWSSNPVKSKLHYDLENKLNNLAESGRGWARCALDEDTSKRIYFSAAGFNDEFRAIADQSGDMHLITLEDLFPREN